MQTTCNFLGLVISMYFLDHYPPHIHVASQDCTCKINIETLEVIDGVLPVNKRKLVLAFVSEYKEELLNMWKQQKIYKIEN